MEKINQNDKQELSEQKQFEKEKLIRYISVCSSLYGDKLVEFMEENNLVSLREATVAQLKTYIATHDLKPVELPKKRLTQPELDYPVRPLRPFKPKDREPEVTR